MSNPSAGNSTAAPSPSSPPPSSASSPSSASASPRPSLFTLAFVRFLARVCVFLIGFAHIYQAVWLSSYHYSSADEALQESSSLALQQQQLKEQFFGSDSKKQPTPYSLRKNDPPQTATRHHDIVTTNTTKNKPPRKHERNDSPFHFVICTRMRNEGPYIREWIEYHRMIGVQAFMIMNDNSTDETQCILDEYIQQGIVYQVTSERGEAFVFDICVEQIMKRVLKNNLSARDMEKTWIATHDVDEFIWLDPNITQINNNNNKTSSSSSSPLELVVRTLLDRYTSMQSIIIPRFLFGTSGHDHYQPDLVIGRFTKRFDVEQCPQQQEESQQRRRLSIAFAGGGGDGDNSSGLIPQDRRPVSMCSPLANVTTSYPGDGKSMSIVPALARNCWKPVLEEIRRKNTTQWTQKRNRCHTTHFHQLRNRSHLASDSLVFREQERVNMDRILKTLHPKQNSGSSHTGEMKQQQHQQSDYYDDRFVGYGQVVDSIAIMHYMTRSKEEFFQRTCASDFLKKYQQCSDCSPETYLELAESYSNNLQDERMMPLVKPLQERLLFWQKNNGNRSSSSSSRQCHVEPLRSTEPWEYYRECWRTKKIAYEKVQQEEAKFGKRKRRRPRATG